MKGNLKRRPIVVPEDRAPVDSIEVVSKEEMLKEVAFLNDEIWNNAARCYEKIKMISVVGSVIAGALLVMILRKDER
jgi:hypothetical protein